MCFLTTKIINNYK